MSFVIVESPPQSPPKSPCTRRPRSNSARSANSLPRGLLNTILMRKKVIPTKSDSFCGDMIKTTQSKRRYDITRKIASGMFGTVYMAHDRVDDCGVAIKLISRHACPRWHVEAFLGKDLDHPGIARMLDMYSYDDTRMALVFEYAPDCDLFDWVNDFHEEDGLQMDGVVDFVTRSVFASEVVHTATIRRNEVRLSISPGSRELVTRHLGRQLVSALQYCHSRQVYHRDIKPENIRIESSTLTVRLVDFGMGHIDVAKRAGGVGDDADEAEATAAQPARITESTARRGTIYYVPPELLNPMRGCPPIPEKSDVWSLAVVLYTIAHGYWPYVVEARTCGWFAISAWDVCSSDFSSGMKDLIRRMSMPTPETRPTMDMVANHAWFIGDQGGGESQQHERSNGVLPTSVLAPLVHTASGDIQ